MGRSGTMPSQTAPQWGLALLPATPLCPINGCSKRLPTENQSSAFGALLIVRLPACPILTPWPEQNQVSLLAFSLWSQLLALSCSGLNFSLSQTFTPLAPAGPLALSQLQPPVPVLLSSVLPPPPDFSPLPQAPHNPPGPRSFFGSTWALAPHNT